MNSNIQTQLYKNNDILTYDEIKQENKLKKPISEAASKVRADNAAKARESKISTKKLIEDQNELLLSLKKQGELSIAPVTQISKLTRDDSEDSDYEKPTKTKVKNDDLKYLLKKMDAIEKKLIKSEAKKDARQQAKQSLYYYNNQLPQQPIIVNNMPNKNEDKDIRRKALINQVNSLSNMKI